MNAKDIYVQKILAELGLRNEPQLTPAQEETLQTALDPNEQELADMLRVLQNTENNT